MRRAGSGVAKTEMEGLQVGPPKNFLDVKLERMHNGQDLHAADGKSKLLRESAAVGFSHTQAEFSVVESSCFLQMVWRG